MAQQDTAYIYTYGGEKDEQGRDIQLTTDSGFIMVGSTSSFGKGNSDIYLVKVDSSLKYEWSAAIGHQFTEFGHAVKQTTDGGYIIAGMTNSLGNGNYDAYLVRTDVKGNKLWEKTYGGFDWDMAYDVEITSDGGFMVVGETHSLGKGDADAYLIRTDKDGNVVWEKTLGGKKKDIAHALIKTRDGNYAFCGENASKNDTSKGDAWLVKFKEDGSVVFDTTHVLPEYDVAYGLCETKFGELVLTGKSRSKNITVFDVLLQKFTPTGEHIWTTYHGGINQGKNNKNDEGFDVLEYNDTTLLIVGTTYTFSGDVTSDIYSLRTDKFGNWKEQSSSLGNIRNDNGFGISLFKEGWFVAFGNSESFIPNYSNFVCYKLEFRTGVTPTDTLQEFKDNLPASPLLTRGNKSFDDISIYPNPTNGQLFFSGMSIKNANISIYNTRGEFVKVISQDENSIRLDEKSPSGLYVIQLQTDDKPPMKFTFVKE